MFHIPVRPGEYSRLDQLDGLHADDVVPSPFPPVSAGKAALAMELHEQVRVAEREERRQRRLERLINWWFWPALFLVAVLSQAGTIWHALGMVQP